MTLERDKNGYTGYAVVVMMPDDVQRKVAAVRGQLTIPVPMIPAHVTVKGTFVRPPDLDEIVRIVNAVADETAPLSIELQEQLLWGREGARTVAISVKSSLPVDGLHRKLFNAIQPITTNVYGREAAEGFHFHMTVYQEVDEPNHRKGLALAAGLHLPDRVDAHSMCLMARIGPRGPGGEWHILQEFPCGRGLR